MFASAVIYTVPLAKPGLAYESRSAIASASAVWTAMSLLAIGRELHEEEPNTQLAIRVLGILSLFQSLK